MRIRNKLLSLARVVADEAERNPEFAQKIGAALGIEQRDGDGKKEDGGRSRKRRAPAAFDPVAVLRAEGDSELRSRLSTLDLEQLKDIVAQHGMDPGRLVMKWKTRERVVNRIVEMSMSRASKGDAFREDTRTEPDPSK